MPGFWVLLAGLVASSSESEIEGPNSGAALALGLASIPFVFIVLAFLSEHPKAPAAVLKAMGLALLVGIPVSALAGDALTGIVTGVGPVQSLRFGWNRPTPTESGRLRSCSPVSPRSCLSGWWDRRHCYRLPSFRSPR